MEGEIYNFIVVWTIVFTCLCYTHTIVKFFPKGKSRILVITPIIFLFSILPLYLTSIHLCANTAFFITWLGNFKLILFAFDKGPLYSTPPLPLPTFIPLACLPIKFQAELFVAVPVSDLSNGDVVEITTKKSTKSTLNHVIKVAVLAILIRVYSYKDYLHPNIILFFYSLHIYFMLEIILTMVGTMVRALSRVELEPPFDEPYLASSLQDFWGRRWNLMVTNILRPTVYEPVRSMLTNRIPRECPLPAVLATFFVSGLMHELIFYYIGRLKPDGQALCFFIIHGVALSLEIVMKKLLNGKIWVPRFISGPLALSFVIYTSFWLFFPPFLRGKADYKVCSESLALFEFVRHGRLVSPTNITCPLL